jgi:hypothetical protein
MEEEQLIDVVFENLNEWTDEEIGEFVRRGLTEDVTVDDLEKDMGIDKIRG